MRHEVSIEDPGLDEELQFTKRELETILERDVLPAAIPEFPTMRLMTLGMNSPMVVPSPYARATVEQQQKMFLGQLGHLFHRVFGSGIFPYV